MKNKLRKIAFMIFLATFTVISNSAISQPPPPPGQGSNDSNQTGSGGGAPIGSGWAILIVLATAYGGRKIYKSRKISIES